MRILFVGESWLGSCARSLKEAMTRQPGVDLDEVNEDLHVQICAGGDGLTVVPTATPLPTCRPSHLDTGRFSDGHTKRRSFACFS